MPEIAFKPAFAKARILTAALVDVMIDLLLPTAIYYLLAPTHQSAVIRLTIGGYFVAAKAGAGHISPDDAGAQSTGFFRGFVLGALVAAVATAVTLGTVAAGLSDATAIMAGTALLALVQGVRLLRGHRKLDGFALLVLVEMAATIILTSISNTPRFILVRPSFYTAIAGFYVLFTIRAERPFMMQISKPMASEGNPVRAEAFERAGRESARFRRAEQGMTAGLGVVLLAEAVLRVVMVWSHPESDVIVASLWSQILSIGLFVAYFVVIRLVCIPVASREVDSLMPDVPKFRDPAS